MQLPAIGSDHHNKARAIGELDCESLVMMDIAGLRGIILKPCDLDDLAMGLLEGGVNVLGGVAVWSICHCPSYVF